MPDKRPLENILSFPSKKYEEFQDREVQQQPKQPVHPVVRRRRLLWLGCMVVFMLWFLGSMVFQQFRIWDYQERLVVKQQQIKTAQQEMLQLKQSIKKLQNEDYIIELAHKLGYRYPDEENYEVRER